MIDLIVEHTNMKIEKTCIDLVLEEKAQTYHHHTDAIEIRAMIGVLYYCGMWKASQVDNNRLWDKSNGITVYRCVFSRARFNFLLSCLRFDNKEERNADDRFAHIRQLWDLFMANCTNNYTSYSECTVDEQLLSFRGRCKFRVYMKDKPDKYGLKIISLNDSQTSYMIFAIPYLGKNSETLENGENVSEYYFRLVTVPIYNSHRTVTCDNWYTSIPLITKMLKDPYKIKITGTIRKNKPEIPSDFIASVAKKDRPRTKFCHTNEITLLTYAPKKKANNKIVLLASSFMHTDEMTDDKANIFLYYNRNKGGTDTFDKLCHSYSVHKKSNRWPLRYFFGMLDQAAVNARILLTCKYRNDNISKKVSAVDCLNALYLFLTKPQLQRRLEIETLRADLRLGISTILKKRQDIQRNLVPIEYDAKKRCTLCSRKKDVKTRRGCSACLRPACNDHSVVMCIDCIEN